VTNLKQSFEENLMMAATGRNMQFFYDAVIITSTKHTLMGG
jgi:hypothetical protein